MRLPARGGRCLPPSRRRLAFTVQWRGELYLEDGLHRALRAALQQRNVIHVRVLDLDAVTPVQG